jgi:hypothetical protein
MIRRQLTDHLLRGATVLGAMSATLAVASAFSRTPPLQPMAMMVPAAQANETPGTVVVYSAEETVDGSARPELRVRRSLSWAPSAPKRDLASVQLSNEHTHRSP